MENSKLKKAKLYILLLVAMAFFAGVCVNNGFAFRNNCDAIMSDIMDANREEKDIQQFLSETRKGTAEYNRLGRDLRKLSSRQYQLRNEYQKCIEWRKKNQ